MIHVLMVESEPRNLIGAKTHIEKDGDISLETARNMEEGLKKLKSDHYNVIISAYELQGQDGAAFLRAAKRISPSTPMFLYSMKCREERLITFLMMETKNIGADFLLVRGETDEARFSQLSEHIRAEYGKKTRDDQADHRNSVLLALKNIGLISIENKGIDRIIGEICSAIVESGAYGHAWIVLTSENGRVTGYAQAGIDNDFDNLARGLDKSELPDCIQNALKDTGIIASKDPKSSCPKCPLSPAYGGLGAMTIALRDGGKVYGAVSVSLGYELIIDESEQDLFEETGKAISSVIHRMDVDRERIRSRREISAQQQLGRKLAEAETLDEVIRYVVESSVSASEMDCGALYLVDDSTGGFTLAASRGLSDGYARRYSGYPPESELAASIFAKKTIYSWYGSVEMHMLGVDDEVDEGLRAVALVPIIYRDHVIGYLHVSSHMRDDVPQVCRDAFETIAAQAANAIIRIQAERISPSIELLREISRLTRTTRKAPALAEKACQRISSGPGFSGAMIAILEEDTLLVSSHCGDDTFEETVSSINDGLIPGDATESLSSGKAVERVNDDGSVVFTAMKAIGEGRQMILAVSAGKRYELDAEAPDILNEMTEELSYAFGALLTREELESASEKLKLQDELLSVEKILKEKSESLMPSLFCAIGTDGTIIRSNALFSQATGKSAEEIRGLDFTSFFPDEYGDGIKRHFTNISEKGAADHEISFSAPLITASGEEISVEWRCTVVRSHSGTTTQILCSGRDLSEMKRSEERYNEVLARYAGTISSVEEGIIVSGPSGTVLSINPAAERLTGLTQEEAAGAALEEVIDLIDEHTGEQIALQPDGKKEGLLRSKKGEECTAEVSYGPVKDGRGVVTGHLAVIRDISGIHETFEAKTRFEAIFDTSGPVILTDLEGRIEFWNSDAERVTGRSAGEMAGDDAFACFPPGRRADIEKILSNASGSRKTGSFRSYLLAGNGREIPVLARGAPLFDRMGEPRGAAISFQDLSGEVIERERAEELGKKFSLLREAARITSGQAGDEEIARSLCEMLVSPGWFEDAWMMLGREEAEGRIIWRCSGEGTPEDATLSMTPCTRRAMEFSGPVVTKPGSTICEDCPVRGRHADLGAVTVPLSFMSRIYGVLGVSGRTEKIDEGETKEILSEIGSMASHAVSSIESGRSLERIETQASIQHKLAERLGNAATIKKVTDAILDSAIQAASGSAGAVYMYEPENEALLLYDAVPQEVMHQSLDRIPTDSEPGEAILSGEPLLIRNMPDSGSRLLNDLCPVCMAVPLVHMNRPMGSLIVGLDAEVQPDEQLVKTLESIASYGASSIDRIRTGQSEPFREAAMDIAMMLKGAEETGELPAMICRRLCETPGIRGASVSFAGETEDTAAECGDPAGDGDSAIITRTLSFSGRDQGSVALNLESGYASNPEVSEEIDHICGDLSFALDSAAKARDREEALLRLSGSLEELESELRGLERAENLSQVLIAELNPDRSVRRINEELASLAGAEAAAIIGTGFEELFVTEDEREEAAGCISALSESGQGNEAVIFSATMPLPDGGRRWIEWKCANADDSSGIICSGRDLTAAKEAEDRAGSLLAGYMGTLSAVDDGVIVSDRLDRIVMINTPARLLAGWPETEAKGKEVAEVLRLRDELTGEPLELSGITNAECILSARDGGERPVRVSRQEAPDEQGTVHGYVTVVRDISGQRSEREGSFRLEAVIGAAGPVVITNLSGIVTDLNGDAIILTGADTDNSVGRHIRELIPPENSAAIDGLIRETAEGGSAPPLETRISAEGGDERWVRLRASPVRNEEGAITGVAVGFTDISGEVSGRERTEMMERNLSLLKKAKGIARDMTATEDILGAVCSLLESESRYEQAVALLAGEDDLLRYAAGSGSAELDETGGNIPGCLGKAFRFGGCIVTSSPSPVCEECPLSGLHDGHDVLALRLEHGGEGFGVLAVSGNRGVWDETSAQEAAADVSEIASLAVFKLEAEKERVSSSRQASSQKDLAERLSVIASPQKAASAVVKAVTGPLGLGCGTVYLYDDKTKCFVRAAHSSSIDDISPNARINGDSEAGRIIMSGRTSSSGRDTETEEREGIFGSPEGGPESYAIVPMIYKNSIIGVLVAGSGGTDAAIKGPLCDTLESIASYGASSIHRIRIEQVRDLITTGERIGRILRETKTSEEIIDRACTVLSETDGIREASYVPVPPEEAGAETEEAVDETEEALPKSMEFRLEAGGITYGAISVTPDEDYLDNPEIAEVMTIIVQDIADALHGESMTQEMNEAMLDLEDRSAELDSEKSRLEITGSIVASYLAELTASGNIRWINRSLADALGAPAEELTGRDFADLLEQGEAADRIRDLIERVANDGTTAENEVSVTSFRSSEGTIRTAEWRCSGVRDRTGAVSGILCSGNDISDLIHADERLSMLASRLTGTLDSLDDAVILTDDKGVIVSMNARAEDLTGREGAGERYDGLLHLTDESGNEEIDLTFDLEDIPGTVTGADGSERFVRATARTIRRDDGAVSARVIVIRDVTPEIKSGESIRKMEALLKSSGEPIAEVSGEGIITGWNEFAEEETGYPAPEILGRHISELIPEEIREEAGEEIMDLISGERDGSIDTVITCMDGTALSAEILVSPLSEGEGEKGATVRWRNITGEKIEKRRLARINRILEAVVGIQKASNTVFESAGAFCEECCRILTATGGAKTAVISLTEDGHEEIHYSGPGECSSTLIDRLGSGEVPEFIEIAMEHPGIIDLDDIGSASKDEEINRIFRGKRVLAVRLEDGERIFGYITVSVMKTDMFPRDHDWFEMIAGAISTGISAIVQVERPEPDLDEIDLASLEEEIPVEPVRDDAEIDAFLSFIEKPVIVAEKSGDIVRENPPMRNLYQEITGDETAPVKIQDLFPGYEEEIFGCLESSHPDGGISLNVQIILGDDAADYTLEFSRITESRCLIVITKKIKEDLFDVPEDLKDISESMGDILADLDGGFTGAPAAPDTVPASPVEEEVLNAILSAFGGYMAIVDVYGHIIRGNAASGPFYGEPEAEGEPEKIDSIVDPASGRTITDLIMQAGELMNEVTADDLLIISPDGEYLPANVRVTPLPDASYLVSAEYAKKEPEEAAEEITGQKPAEYLDIPGTAFAALDEEGRVILINPRMKEITGVSVDLTEERGHTIHELIDPAKSAIITEYIHMMDENPDIPPLIRDFQFTDANGNTMECDIAISRDREKGITALSFTDVSEYARSIRELEEELKEVKEAGGEKTEVVGIRCKDKFIYLNSAGLKFFGVNSLIDLSHKPIIEYVHPDYRDESRERTRLSYIDKKPTSFTYMEFVRDDGTVIHGETATVPLYYGVEPASLVVIKNTGTVGNPENEE